MAKMDFKLGCHGWRMNKKEERRDDNVEGKMGESLTRLTKATQGPVGST